MQQYVNVLRGMPVNYVLPPAMLDNISFIPAEEYKSHLSQEQFLTDTVEYLRKT